MSIQISSGNTTTIATDSAANGAQYQIIKIADGSANSSATVSASVLYGLQVDIARSVALNSSITGTPSVTASQGGVWAVNASITGNPSVMITQGLNVSSSQIGNYNVSATQLGVWGVNASLSGLPSVTLFGIPSVAILGNITTSPNVSLTGSPSVTLYGIPSVAIMGTINTGNSSVSQLAIWNVSATFLGVPSVAITGGGSHNVTATQLGIWNVTATQTGAWNTSISGSPSVSLFGTPSVAITATASVASLRKSLLTTNTVTTPVVLWSNAATARWCLTNLVISVNNTCTVTLLDGIASIGTHFFMPYGGMANDYNIPLKSGGIGSNLMITAVGTASSNFTATGYETT